MASKKGKYQKRFTSKGDRKLNGREACRLNQEAQRTKQEIRDAKLM